MTNTTELIIRAIEIAGSEAKLGAAAGFSQNAVWHAKRTGRVSARLAKGIDAATHGKVPCWKLRPDLWERPSDEAEPPREHSGKAGKPQPDIQRAAS